MLPTPRPRSRRRARSSRNQSAVWAIGLQFFFNGATVASFFPRLPEIRDRVGISTGTLGLLLSLAALAGIAGSGASSWVIERVGSRRVIVVGGVAIVIGLAVIGIADAPAVLAIGLGSVAAVDAAVDVAMNLQGSRVSATRETPIMNRLHGLWSVGMVSGGVAATQLATMGVSLATHLLGAAVVLLALLAVVAGGLVDAYEPGSAGTGPPSGVSNDQGAGVGSYRPLALLALAGAFAGAVEFSSNDWAAFRLADDFGASAGFAGLGFVAFATGMAIGRLGADFVQARIGGDKLLWRAGLLAAVGLVGVSVVPNDLVTIGFYVLAGLAIAPFFPRLYDEAAKHNGRQGAGLGALTVGMRTAALVVPATVGAVIATGQSVGSATAMITVPSIVGFLLVVALRNPKS